MTREKLKYVDETACAWGAGRLDFAMLGWKIFISLQGKPMRSLFMLLILLSCGKVFAQAPDTLWTRTYGNNEYDRCFSSAKLAGDDYLFAGYTQLSSQNLDGQVIAIDSYGDSLWSRKFGGTGIEFFQSIIKTSSEEYLAVGATQSYGNGADDAWAVLLSQGGDSIWQIVAGGSQQEFCYGSLELPDGSFIIYGFTTSFGAGDPDGWILKVSSDGDSLASRQFMGTPGSVFTSSCFTSDGTILLAGSKSSTISSDDYWLVRIDESLDTIWTKTYGGVLGEQCYSIVPNLTGGAALCGHSSSFGNGQSDFWVLTVDSLGDSISSKSYGRNGYEHCFTAIRTYEGGILLGGVTNAGSNSDALLVKIDSQLDSLWSFTLVRPGNEECWTVQQSLTGEFKLGGITFQTGNELDDWLLIGTERDPQFPTSRVVAPNGAEQLSIFFTNTIRWTGVGFEGGVSIKLNRHYPIGIWETITDSTENDGEFEWFVTDPLSDLCRVQICALHDTLCDISDGNFSIVSSQGYLAVVKSNQPTLPLTSWNGGVVECPSAVSQWFRVKNFGSESIVVFQPQEPASAEFSRTTTCGAFFALAPNQMSSCSLRVTFDPTGNGSYSDVLRIQTDAVNGIDGFVNIALGGSQISTPAAPNVVISPAGLDVDLNWSVVDTSVGGCAVSDLWYAVFYAPTSGGPFYYHGWTPDTSYTHYGVVNFSPTQFYQVVAVSAPNAVAAELEEGEEMGSVLRKMENRKLKIEKAE